jgi:hypothetical protein
MDLMQRFEWPDPDEAVIALSSAEESCLIKPGRRCRFWIRSRHPGMFQMDEVVRFTA